MESGTKLRLEEAVLKVLVREAFGTEPEEIEELSDGWANTAYRVRLPGGRRVVLKLAPLPEVKQMRYEVKLMQTEVDMLERLDGVLPVPRVLAYDTSRRLVASDYFFMEHLDGTPFDKLKPLLNPEERGVVERQLGQYNRTLNEIRGDRFGPYLAPAAAGIGWYEVFLGMIRDVLEDGKEMAVEFPVPVNEIVSQVENSRNALEEVKEPRLLHWDLWAGNVFVLEGEISGIIDFERAIWGDPLIEAYFRSKTMTEAFRQGYGWEESFTAAEETRRLLYDLYLHLVMHVERPFRQFTSPDHEAWTRDRLLEDWKRIRGIPG
ncbi:MAG: aminoglycoside phosphotransferase family protein [Paenibacillaceae bacterium]|jgi:aminoglycoside phosphotransferase (APT) family kinase protein|nr:aminoglycoside phosphotransferase family protein [Paenibacillaceae bacterium]